MIFGKIEYLNLLPFHVFMKHYTKSSQQAKSMEYYKGVPANINKKFATHKVDAAFISSINARKQQHVQLGIIAKREVLSVLVVPNDTTTKDNASASSNILADVLGISGEVIIGDKALKYYLAGNYHVDLAGEWNSRYNLPFVFALLCFHNDKKRYEGIEKAFLKKRVKIPYYLLQKASKKTSVPMKDILFYLNYISYDLDYKAQKGLKLFYKLSQKA